MNKTGWLLAIITLLIIVAALILFILPSKTVAPTTDTTPQATTTPVAETPRRAEYPDMLVVDAPTIGATIASPLVITGKARGGWYFEASFPVQLKDASGKVIAEGPAQAQGDWMTEQFVPFKATLTFAAQPKGSKGTLVVRNDNPSGLPENDRMIEIPVVFE